MALSLALLCAAIRASIFPTSSGLPTGARSGLPDLRFALSPGVSRLAGVPDTIAAAPQYGLYPLGYRNMKELTRE